MGKHTTNTEDFVHALQANYNTRYTNLTFDKTKQRGTIQLGWFDLNFWEHGSDAAVCVNITMKGRVKSNAENMIQLIENLSDLLSNSSD